MSDFALNVLRELVGYYPAVIPCIVIFYSESFSSLQFWKAVQRIPLRETDNGESKDETNDPGAKKSRSSKLLKMGIAFVVLFFTALYLVPELLDDVAQAQQLKIFYLCTLIIPFTVCVPATILMPSGVCMRGIVRDSEGKAAIIQRKVKTIGSIPASLLLVLGALVAFSALWFEQPAAMLIVYLSIFHYFSSNTISKSRVKFRTWFWFALVLGVYDTALTMAFAVYKPANPFAYGLHVKGQSTAIQWNSIFLSTLSLSAVPLSILSILLRFDYTNFLPAGYEPPVYKRTIGFRIVYSRLEAFSRPYYTTSFIVLCGSFIGIAALSAAGYVKCTFENVGFFVTFMASPAMVIAALVQAAMRGQVGKLWSYEEDWAAIPTVNQEAPVDAGLLENQSEDSEEKKDEEKDLIFFDEESGFVGEEAV